MTPEDAERILLEKGEYGHVVAAVYDGDEWRDRLVRIVLAVRAEEREACAKVADQYVDPCVEDFKADPRGREAPCTFDSSNAALEVARAIRART